MASASHEFRGSVDFNQFELRNATFQRLLVPPVGPVDGQIYYSSVHNIPFYRTPTGWKPFGIQPVHIKYNTLSNMIQDQSLHIEGYLYYSEENDIYYEYLGTANENISDYNPIGGSGINTTYTAGSGLTLTGTEFSFGETNLIWNPGTGIDYGGNWEDNFGPRTLVTAQWVTQEIIDNGYIHPTFTAFNPTLSGANVLSTFSTNTQGHVTTLTTRTLLPSDIGAVPTSRVISTGTGLVGGGNLTADRNLEFDVPWGDNRYHNRLGLINIQSEFQFIGNVEGIQVRANTSGSSGFPSTLGSAVAFYTGSNDATSAMSRAFAFYRIYGTQRLFFGTPGSSANNYLANWREIYHTGNLTPQTIGGVPDTRTITINGVTQDLSANRTWSVGTVTSVGLSLPNIFSVTNSPVTTSGTLTASFVNQSAYTVFARATGSGVPSFQSLVVNHLPNNIPFTKLQNVTANRLLGRLSGNGVIQELTNTEVRGLLNVYSQSEVDGLLHPPVTLGTANGLSLSGQQLSLGLASGSTTGALSSANWTTFNNKIGGTIAVNQVAFGTGAGVIGGDDGITYISSNGILSLNQNPNGYLGFDQRRDSFTTNIVTSSIYQSGQNGSAYPFTVIGNLVLQSRSSFNRDIVFVTGADPEVRASISNTGIDIRGTTRVRTLNNTVGDIVTANADGVFSRRTRSQTLLDIEGMPQVDLGIIPDHVRAVVLLHKLDNTVQSANFNFTGQINWIRSNNLTQPITAFISSGKRFNTETPIGYCSRTGVFGTYRTVTCTYLGEKWLALEIYPSPAQGRVTVSGSWTDRPIRINVFNNQTSTVLNAEINDSIEEVFLSTATFFEGALTIGSSNTLDTTTTLDNYGRTRLRNLLTAQGDFVQANTDGVLSRRTTAQVLSQLNIDNTAYQRDAYIYSSSNVFTLTQTPLSGLEVYVNGQKKRFGVDYTVSGTTLTIDEDNVKLDEYTSPVEIEAVYFYSLTSITSGAYTGEGTTNRLTKWLGTTQFGVASISDNGSEVEILSKLLLDNIDNGSGNVLTIDGKEVKFRTYSQLFDDLNIQTQIDTGNLLEGTGVIFDGDGSDRLVGSGDLTINVSRNIDGGSASTVYLTSQSINGGTA